MSSYSTTRHTAVAAALVATFASLVSNGLALDQRLIYERDVLATSAGAPAVLPEVVVVASRIET